jgi:hypothetical protein
MRINDHQKKGSDKAVDFKGNLFKLKLYPPSRNIAKGVYLAKGGNIPKYRVKVNTLSKPRSDRPLITLALQPIQKFGHKCKKEITPPLEIRDEVQEDFVCVYKKCFTKHGGQAVKQVSKLDKIFECTILLKPITQEKLQHNGIGSRLFYLNLQPCNVSISFDKIQLAIVKCSQNINLIFNVQLKCNLYQFMWNMF